MTKFQPYGNFLMLEPDKVDEVSPGGIIIPEQARASLNQGVITKMGPLVSEQFHVGDRVVFTNSSEYRLRLDGELVIVLDAVNVLLVAPLQVTVPEAAHVHGGQD